MNWKYISLIAFSLLLWILTIGCQSQSSSKQAISQGESNATMTAESTSSQEFNNSIAALSMLPVGANHVHFTNWSLIKEYEGFQNVTSSGGEEWTAFFQAVAQRHAILPGYGVRHLSEHAATWSWDTADLEWEASTWISAPPGYVLKFREDFDFTILESLFEERGFTKEVYQGVTVYSHKVDLRAEWLRRTENSILNTAIVSDAQMLVMSISKEHVHDMIDVYQGRAASLADDPVVQETANRLGQTFAGYFSADVCSVLKAETLRERVILTDEKEELELQLKELPQLRRYDTLGIGYRYENNKPQGVIVLHFPDRNQANADFESRVNLAEKGFVRRPASSTYSDVYFSLLHAIVEENKIVMEVQPTNDKPGRLFSMAHIEDMTFALCP